MDKNFLIAIILSTVAILIFSSPQYHKKFGKSYPKKQKSISETVKEQYPNVQRPKKEQQSELSAAVTPSESLKTKTVKDSLSVQSAKTVQIDATVVEKDIILENEDMRIVLSTRAGAIKTVTMKKFTVGDNDTLVQLIAAGETWYDGVVYDNPDSIKLTDVIFVPDTKTTREVLLKAALTGSKAITRAYSLDERGYILHASTILEGSWKEPGLGFLWNAPVNITEEKIRMLKIWPFSLMMPDETAAYDNIIYLGQGDRITSADSGKEKKSRIYTNEGSQKIDAKKNSSGTDYFEGDLTWYAVRNKYFMSAAIPQDLKLWKANALFNSSSDHKWYEFMLTKRVADGSTDLDIYLGPISFDILDRYGKDLTKIIDLSWAFIRPLAIFFLWLIKKIHMVIPNWGIVIIIFSIIIKVVLYPLSHKSIVSMKKMSSLQPQLTVLKEKFRNNPQKLHQATMELYKKEGVSPFSGCLPILLQMPVFFALYPVIGRTFDLRQAMFIPRWIEDLSRPDPFYILPIAMGISMFIQSKDTMTDPNQKAMIYIMPVMMVILFANFSAGLTLYWLLFNILSYIQQNTYKRA